MRFYLFLAALLTLFSCENNTNHATLVRSFYYWKGNFQWGEFENKVYKKLALNQLYIRFFEIHPGRNDSPAMEAVVNADWTNVPSDLRIVPTIFVLQQVFRDLPDSLSVNLAQQTADKIRTLAAGRPFREVQIDCDWTKTTREPYFAFLQHLKKALPGTQLSATIRLHQIKYRNETGVPPVDRGMLMVYNLSDPTRYTPNNSIFEKREADKYLSGQTSYALPLDMALPLFSWGVHFRDGQFQGFLHDLNRKTVESIGFMAPDKAKNMYKVNADTVFQDTYLRPGDRIRLETVEPADLRDALQLANEVLPVQDTRALAFFHLDSMTLQAFTDAQLDQIYRQMQR